MQVYQGKVFNNQSFVLEEVVFVNCELKDCDLFFSGGDSEWINSKFENCRFHWRGAAKSTFALFQVMGILPQQPPPPIPPTSTAGRPN
jgi:hypothetical protein